MRAPGLTLVLCAACGSPNRLGLHIATTPETLVAFVTTRDKIYARGYTQLYEIGPTGGSATLLDALSPSSILAAAGDQIYFPVLRRCQLEARVNGYALQR